MPAHIFEHVKGRWSCLGQGSTQRWWTTESAAAVGRWSLALVTHLPLRLILKILLKLLFCLIEQRVKVMMQSPRVVSLCAVALRVTRETQAAFFSSWQECSMWSLGIQRDKCKEPDCQLWADNLRTDWSQCLLGCCTSCLFCHFCKLMLINTIGGSQAKLLP